MVNQQFVTYSVYFVNVFGLPFLSSFIFLFSQSTDMLVQQISIYSAAEVTQYLHW